MKWTGLSLVLFLLFFFFFRFDWFHCFVFGWSLFNQTMSNHAQCSDDLLYTYIDMALLTTVLTGRTFSSEVLATPTICNRQTLTGSLFPPFCRVVSCCGCFCWLFFFCSFSIFPLDERSSMFFFLWHRSVRNDLNFRSSRSNGKLNDVCLQWGWYIFATQSRATRGAC